MIDLVVLVTQSPLLAFELLSFGLFLHFELAMRCKLSLVVYLELQLAEHTPVARNELELEHLHDFGYSDDEEEEAIGVFEDYS